MNKKYKFDFFTSFILVFLLTLTITFSSLDREFTILDQISQYSFILLSIIFFLILLIRKTIKKKDILFLFPFILLMCLYTYKLDSLDGNIISRILVPISFVLLMFTLYKVNISQKQLLMFYLFTFIIYLILGIALLTESTNTNTIGAFAYFIIFLPLLYTINFTQKNSKLKGFLLFALMITLVLLSSTRSILLAIIFFIITYFLWKALIKYKILFYTWFLFSIFIVTFITIIYPKLYLFKNVSKYNDLIYEYTGKNLFSGREQIWAQLLDLIKLKPLFGYGASAYAADYINYQTTAHNAYISVAFQVGIVGITLLLIFLFLIWKLLWNFRNNLSTRLVGSFFISMLIYQVFERSLIQGNYAIGILQWIILGVGLNYASQVNKKEKDIIYNKEE